MKLCGLEFKFTIIDTETKETKEILVEIPKDMETEIRYNGNLYDMCLQIFEDVSKNNIQGEVR